MNYPTLILKSQPIWCQALGFVSLRKMNSSLVSFFNLSHVLFPTGYFRLHSTQTCGRCSSCYRDVPGHQFTVIPECERRMNDSGSVCLPIDYVPLPRDEDKQEEKTTLFRNYTVITAFGRLITTTQAIGTIPLTTWAGIKILRTHNGRVVKYFGVIWNEKINNS